MRRLTDALPYAGETELFVLGPEGSGKSLFLVGLLNTVRERLDGDTPAESPSVGLQELADAFSSQSQDAGWGTTNTTDPESDLRFGFTTGGLVSKRVVVSCPDYSEGDVARLADALPSEVDRIDSTTLRELKRNVESADGLIYIVDCERFVNDESLDIAPYFDIISAVREKQVVVVATKADLLADEFRDERGKEPSTHFDEFTWYTNDRLKTDARVQALVNTTDTVAHPVYYQTRDEDGSRKPMRNPDGGANLVGFDELIDTLG